MHLLLKILLVLIILASLTVLAFLVNNYFLASSTINQTVLINSSTSSYKPVTKEPVSLTLNLSAPEDNLLVFDSDLLIAGKTSPKANVIISLDEDNFALEANDRGDFSTTVKVKNGPNKITVSSFDNLGNKKEENRMVFYSTEKL